LWPLRVSALGPLLLVLQLLRQPVVVVVVVVVRQLPQR
jgi:hypothetical protein